MIYYSLETTYPQILVLYILGKLRVVEALPALEHMAQHDKDDVRYYDYPNEIAALQSIASITGQPFEDPYVWLN